MVIYGVILAGGRGSRMGGVDKALVTLAGQTLMAHAVARLGPQVATLAINSNRDPAGFTGFGLPVLADDVPDLPGPLAGVLAGLEWAAAAGAEAVVTVAVDTPFFPGDLVPRLMLGCETAPIALARSGSGWHPTFGLWPVAVRRPLRAVLLSGERRVLSVAQGLGAGFADFPDTRPDSFFNINTPQDLAQAETWTGGQV